MRVMRASAAMLACLLALSGCRRPLPSQPTPSAPASGQRIVEVCRLEGSWCEEFGEFEPSLLPAQVQVLLADGTATMVPVTWDLSAVPTVLEHDFELTGRVAGTDLPAQLPVAVLDTWLEAPLPTFTAAELAEPNLVGRIRQAIAKGEPNYVAWNPAEDAVAFVTDCSVYIWQVGQPAAGKVAPADRSQFGGLSQPSWSGDGQYLLVHNGYSSFAEAVVIRYPERELARVLPASVFASWSLNGHELLLTQQNQIKLSEPVAMEQSTDLVLFDVDSGTRRVLLAGDDRVAYFASGWADPEQVLYRRIVDGKAESEQTMAISR